MPNVNNFIILYSSSVKPYKWAAYLIILISNAKITGISAKGIGTSPAKEDIAEEEIICEFSLIDAFCKKSSFYNILSEKSIFYKIRNPFVVLNLLSFLLLQLNQ